MNRRLFRSKKNKVFTGVCGGIGEYFNIDPNIIRIAYIAIGLFTFPMSAIAYIVGVFIIPQAKEDAQSKSTNQSFFNENDDFSMPKEDWDTNTHYDAGKGNSVMGIVMIGLGVVLLFQQVFRHLLDFKYLVPIILLVIGISVITKGKRR